MGCINHQVTLNEPPFMAGKSTVSTWALHGNMIYNFLRDLQDFQHHFFLVGLPEGTSKQVCGINVINSILSFVPRLEWLVVETAIGNPMSGMLIAIDPVTFDGSTTDGC